MAVRACSWGACMLSRAIAGAEESGMGRSCSAVPRLCLPHGFRTVPAMFHILSKLVLPRSFDFFFHMFFLVKYSNELEEEDFR